MAYERLYEGRQEMWHKRVVEFINIPSFARARQVLESVLKHSAVVGVFHLRHEVVHVLRAGEGARGRMGDSNGII